MTSRQKEFARHYLKGLPAAAAARAAGYAACTAEKNAAEILRAPAVQAYLQRHRQAKTVISYQDLTLLRERVMHIIHTGTPNEALQAGFQLLQLVRIQEKMDPQEMETPLAAPISPAQTDPQPSEDQNTYPPPPIPETDILPTGEPAFDIQFARRVASPKRSQTPTSVNFIPLTGHPKPPPIPPPATTQASDPGRIP